MRLDYEQALTGKAETYVGMGDQQYAAGYYYDAIDNYDEALTYDVDYFEAYLKKSADERV